MKEINLLEMTKKVSNRYMGTKQPMYIYDSTEEFKQSNDYKDSLIVLDMASFYDFLIRYGYERLDKYILLDSLNVWIKTNEKYIPETRTDDGIITYKLDDYGRLIPTDSTYIKLIGLYASRATYLCYCSSGVFSISLSAKWEFTGARSSQYTNVASAFANKESSYDRKIRKCIHGKPSSMEYRILHLMMNPMSDCFMSPEKAFKKVALTSLKAPDRDLYLSSTKFRNLLLKEICIMFPALKEAVQAKISPDKMADMLKNMFEFSLDNQKGGNTENQLKVFDKILEVGYKEDVKITSQVPLIGNDEHKQIAEAKATIVPFEDNVNKEKQLLDDREEVGTISSYVQP